MPNYKLSKIASLEKICLVVQQIMMSQTNLTVLILVYMILMMVHGHNHITEGRHAQQGYRFLSLNVYNLSFITHVNVVQGWYNIYS